MRLLGVTGSMACGKTYVCDKLLAQAFSRKIDLSYVNLDIIRRDILGVNPKYAKLRESISIKLGNHLLRPDTSIDRKELGEIIFNDEFAMNYVKAKTYHAIEEQLIQEIAIRKGLVLVEWALLVEDGMLSFVDNNVLLVTCDDAAQKQRLAGGDLPLDQVNKRIKAQLSNEEKKQVIMEMQKESGKGKLYVFDTSNNPEKEEYKALLEKIIQK